MSKLTKQLQNSEGFREQVYKCSEGKLTIGYGFNIEAGMSEYCANALLEAQIRERTHKLKGHFSFWSDLSEPRQAVLIAMSFQIGVEGLLKFKNTLGAIKDGDFKLASLHGLDSRWYRQTPERAIRLMKQLETNQWQS